MNKEICMETSDSKFDVTRSHFELSIYGIKIYNTFNAANYSHRIYQNTFDKIPGIAGSTGAHIYIQGGILDRIRDNTFGFPYSSQNLSNTGVSATGASRFVIEENDFNRLKTGVFVGNSGTQSSDVRAGDSDVHQDWRGNNFYRCRTNIYTRGQNPRLRLRCNNCKNDLLPQHYVNFHNQGVLANQGIYSNVTPQLQTWGAGNEFTDGSYTNPAPAARFIKSDYSYRYVHHSNFKTTPVEFLGTDLNLQPLYLTKAINSTACPVLGIPFTMPLTGIPAIEEILPIRPDILNEIAYLELQKTNLKNNEDGGKTQQLLDDINNHIPNGQLKNELIANSPLSDTVIIALIIEYPLSHGNFKNVMIRNLPVSNDVSPYFNERLKLLPVGIARQLEPLQGYNPDYITPASLKREIDFLNLEKQLYINRSVNYFMDSIIDGKAVAINLLDIQNTTNAKQVLFATYMQEGDYTLADSILLSIDITSPITADWATLNNILLSLYSNNQSIYNMDSTQIAFVRELAYKCPESLAVANARSILLLLYEEEVSECIEIENRASDIILKDIEFVLPDSDAYMEDNFPDPFTDKTLVNYYLPEGMSGKIIVNDMYGKIIGDYILQEGEQTLELINDNWAPGVYTYTMFADGKLIEVKKMIITHK